ncbi:conjugative relaxase, partial [Halomonas sp. ND22Bw]|uniref:MobF family relaxase n=1 Tax=Halomonas sp. ND22Bw TaxID=2054178 RepID=UPI000D2CB9D7
DDYYVTGEADTPGLEWGGKGAEKVGLTGKARPEDFKAVLEGKHEAFKDPERPDAQADGKHRAGWDLTFSAPKSVSLAILVGKDDRLDKAHDKAVNTAMAYAEKHFAITRVRDQGKIKEVQTGNLLYAQTVHGTSRAGDPQRHTHVIVANATVEPSTGKVRALETLQMFKHSQLLGRIYRAELAKEAIGLGYDVVRDPKQG